MVISIIVIGQNEAGTLPAICDKFIELSNELNSDAELIFVDSDSSDDSISIVSDLKSNNPKMNVTVTKITGDVNAAVGRNEGLKHLNPESEYVFFLDGDIVFEPQFVHEAISILKENKEIGTVTGTVYDCYENDLTFVRNSIENKIVKHHGGNFVTKKEVILSIGYFDESLVKHQDIDYVFRIREKGYVLKKIGISLGRHYTTHYLNVNRVWSDLKKKKYISIGIFFRKYFFTEFRREVLFSGNVTAAMIRLFLICLLLSSTVFHYAFLVWVIFMCLFLSRVKKDRGETILARIASILIGMQFIIGLFVTPQNKKSDHDIINQ